MTSGNRFGPRLYAICLRILPRRIRDRFGAEMRATFEEEWDCLGGPERIRLSARAAMGLLVNAVLLRLDGRLDALTLGSQHESVGVWLRDARTDLRLALRSLRKRPGFSISVVLTLVLGIGLNTAIFSLVHGLLLRPLPYEDAHRLVQLSETAPGIGSMDVSLPDFDLWRSQTQAFSGMFAFDDARFLLTNPDRPDIVQGAVVSPGFLQVLGVAPIWGRGFLATEEAPGSDDVVVISDAMWDQRFARNPAVLDRTLILNGRVRQIVGVAPAMFHFPEVADVWVPLAFEPEQADPEDYGYDVVARLLPGLPIEAALAEADLIAGMLARSYPGTKASIGATAYRLRWADVPTPVAATAVVLLLAVCLVSLLACTNAASLILARGEQRRGEIVVRRALGAGPGRIVRQVLVETTLLGVLGIAGAIWAAYLVVGAIPRFLPADRPFWIHFDLDPVVLAWTGTMGFVACMVMGLPPALRAAGADERPQPGGLGALGRSRRWMLSVQVALATVLVAGATLASRALVNLNGVDVGLNADHVLVVAAPLPPWSYPESETRAELVQTVLAAVRSLPGVSDAAAIAAAPFFDRGAEVALQSENTQDPQPVGVLNTFTDGYFATMQVPVLEGGLPTTVDVWEGSAMAVVSESLAKVLWPGERAVGKHIRHAAEGSRSPVVGDDQEWLEVVAVVGDVRQKGMGEGQSAQIYVPFGRQTPQRMVLVIRTASDPLSLADMVQRRIHQIDATLPFFEPTTIQAARQRSLWTERFAARLLSGFGALALMLAFVGVYGVMAFLTGRRHRELGVRMALGASGPNLLGLILKGAIGILAPGLFAGIIGAGIVSVLFQAVLFEVSALDPLTLGTTAVGLSAVGLLAAYLPARRIIKTDALISLGED